MTDDHTIRSPVAEDLSDPRYRSRVVPNEKREDDEAWAEERLWMEFLEWKRERESDEEVEE